MTDMTAEVPKCADTQNRLNLLCSEAELMGAKIWLVDVDGTLLDTDKLKAVQEAVIEARFGLDVLTAYQNTYAQNRTPDGSIDVDMVIQAVAHNKGIDIEQLQSAVYDYDFSLFVNHDRWQQYLEAAEAEGAKIMLWSEGCVPYQVKKIDKLGITGHIGSSIHKDKVTDLPQLKQFLQLKGAQIIRILDNSQKVIDRCRNVQNDLPWEYTQVASLTQAPVMV